MLALLYDVHGNRLALDAVLADAEAQGATSYLLGGDYALFGPEPEEALARLRELAPATWIRGNGERWCARPEDAPADNPIVAEAVVACRLALGAGVVDELGALPFEARIGDVLYVHASPASDLRSFLPEAAEDEEELVSPVDAVRLVFGHTHLPFMRASTYPGRRGTPVELLNPGSVGMPFDGDPRAAYALVADDGTVLQRRVAYDNEAAAAELRRRRPGAAWAETVARRIELARIDV